MTQLILGSHSPRRKEILDFFSLPFVQVSSEFDESSITFKKDPKEYVCTLSKSKAEVLFPRFPQDIIITADTVVFKEGKIYNKPTTKEEAFMMLTELVGTWHSVFTGVTVRKGDLILSQAEETEALFNALSPEQIHHYQEKIQWSDKAGGYAIQMAGGLIVNKIKGCYYNVMGLPINTVRELLKPMGIDLWDYIK